MNCAAYISSWIRSDLWGFVLLDCYYRQRSETSPPLAPAVYLRTILPDLLGSELIDVVKVHRVLVSVCAQMLYGDFSHAFEHSLMLIERQKDNLQGVELGKIISHYATYGEDGAFAEFLRSHDTGRTANSVIQTRVAVGPAIDQRREMPVCDLDEQIQRAVTDLNSGKGSDLQPESYVEDFVGNAETKAKTFLTKLRDGVKYDERRLALVSVGGADGAEAAYILSNSEIRYGILLEEATSALARADKRADDLRNGKDKKVLEIISGDAGKKIQESTQRLKQWQKAGEIDGVAYSVNSVLHELPRRSSRSFDINAFLYEMTKDWNPLFLLIREPVYPIGWPEFVELSSLRVSVDYLYILAAEVARRLGIPSARFEKYGQHSVLMSSQLALEVMVKLFHLDNLRYEMQECVTSLRTDKIEKRLEYLLGSGAIQREDINSGSFHSNYDAFKIECRDQDGNVISRPRAFSMLVGRRLRPMQV